MVERRSPGERLPLLNRVQESIERANGEYLATEETGTAGKLEMRILAGLLRHELDREALLAWIRARREQEGTMEEGRTGAEDRSQSTWHKIKWVHLPRARFLAPSGRGKNPLQPKMAKFELDYDFEVMDVPVTQGMWMKVMGENILINPSRQHFLQTTPIHFLGQSVQAAPNHPVFDVTPESMVEFANRLSILNGFQPAYTLEPKKERSQEAGGRAENGTLIGHQIYYANAKGPAQLDGYRLPTEQEWLRLTSEFSISLNQLDEPAQVDRLHSVGWFASEHSSSQVEAVGQKEPMAFPDGPVFDLLGLVYEVVVETPPWSFFKKYKTEDLYPRLVARGAAVSRWPGQTQNDPNFKRPDVLRLRAMEFKGWYMVPLRSGFRLVRTVTRE